MRAYRLFDGVPHSILAGDLDLEVTDLVQDSRQVTPGAVFVCRAGTVTDGHNYIDDAMNRGAAGIILTDDLELPGMYNTLQHIFVAKMDDYRRSIGRLCNNFWDHPSRHLTVIAVTGTKGKTTTSYMIKNMLERGGCRTGLIGTIEICDGVNTFPSVNTTPDTLYLHRKLADMVRHGAKYCVMEVSSQGLMCSRISGMDIDIAIYTNLSPDHIGANEHRTFEEYCRWKRKLFSECRYAVINADDIYSGMFGQTAEETGARLVRYGVKNGDAVCGRRVHISKCGGALGVGCDIFFPDGEIMPVNIQAPGKYNVFNALAAASVGYILGIPRESMALALEQTKVRGRMESVPVSDEFMVYIDYAHNAVSLLSVLMTLRKYDPHRILCVYGCGGGRSRNRRMGMGRVSGEYAEMTIITSDNPRMEDPEAIMDDIEAGVMESSGRYVRITDRKEAIRYALTNAERGDIVLLAGKGHETYQEVLGEKRHMDERELIQQILEEEDAGNICGCDNLHIP